MLLRDIADKQRGFKKVNTYLKETFGFSLSSDVSREQLLSAKKEIVETVRYLKIQKNLTPKDSELSKQLLVLEGINILLSDDQKEDLHERASLSTKGDYARIVDYLKDFVMKNIDVGDDLDDAVTQAMKEYRSSKYRFPDYDIEYDVRDLVKLDLATKDLGEMPTELDEFDVDATDRYVVDPESRKNTDKLIKGKHASRDWDKVTTSKGAATGTASKGVQEPKPKYKATNKPTPTKRGQRAQFNIDMSEEKVNMKESYIKDLRTLLEGEVEQAEVIIAAKGFSKELQDMIEKVGRLMNEDLGPVSDQMRQTYGQDISTVFQTTMQAELEGVLNALRGAKESMDDSVSAISAGEMPSDDIGMDADIDIHGGDDELDLEIGGDLEGEEELGMGDEFGGDVAASGPEEEPLGRAALESKSVDVHNQIIEMRQKYKQLRKLQEQKALRNK